MIVRNIKILREWKLSLYMVKYYINALNDTTPYYLIKKDGLKLLVNIHDYILEVIELPENTNDKKFIYGKNKFKQFKKLELTK